MTTTKGSMMESADGQLFSDALMRAVKEKFHYVDSDFTGRKRLYFDNAGGSFRLKKAVERYAEVDLIPDNPERIHEVARALRAIQQRGVDDARLILNASEGTIYASLTASGAMFQMVEAIAEAVPGTNLVTTVLEHPSSFDAMALYAEKRGKSLRVAKSNRVTGGIDVEEILGLIDSQTCLLSLIYASNITGAKLDLERIVREARAIKPDLYIVVDAVQHAPHGLIDLQKTPVDGINFAPYKFFGCRGSGISWLSSRAAVLPHHKLAAKPVDFWDLGSAAPAQFVVVTEIVDYVCWLGSQFGDSADRRSQYVAGIKAIGLHERALLSRMLNGQGELRGLRGLPGVQVLLDHGDLTRRDLILAIAFDDLAEVEAVREYERRGVIVYERVSTSLYSRRMLESFSLTGAVRISPLHCNSPDDIDTFLKVTADIAESAAVRAAERDAAG
ncbi:aminotransferase class V-fold PLP-dependent enzyme [Caballeronia sp. SEWSISQ10-4 2]|uniref:aminotransferase class V-fold PLP-dependent enzyme n=1 Tax=Caballeronia sp. SEWSISQ10-4 2 TaxID=2937438 RepID=UPI00264F99DC|nr:aminotransferase class V-fold PLP-dependent enzyme [Caballeronia sp. SEWSISQ10-4 2]MDN7182591.1 aminotransferase class V-fold PLP-dependent enzyme [Caballeronia sp. SEWSISQ10-4 2]